MERYNEKPPEIPEEALMVNEITGQASGEQPMSENFGVDIHSDEIFELAGETLLRALIQCEYEKITMDLQTNDHDLLTHLHAIATKRVSNQFTKTETPDPNKPLRFVY